MLTSPFRRHHLNFFLSTITITHSFTCPISDHSSQITMIIISIYNNHVIYLAKLRQGHENSEITVCL